MATVLSWTASFLAWVASNLWFLFLIIFSIVLQYKGYTKELYENLTFDENSKSILYKGKEIFVRNPENNNLELTIVNSQTLTDFKRLVGRVIIEMDESRKVNEEEAKRIRLHLQRLQNLLTGEGELEWDSVAETFANSLNNSVIEETDPIGYHARTQTENNELEDVQVKREMAGAIKPSCKGLKIHPI